MYAQPNEGTDWSLLIYGIVLALIILGVIVFSILTFWPEKKIKRKK